MRPFLTAVTRSLHDRVPDAGLVGETTPETRLALVEALTREAWALAGRELPSVPRHDWPVRVRRLGEPT